jgi:hypothetical protein
VDRVTHERLCDTDKLEVQAIYRTRILRCAIEMTMRIAKFSFMFSHVKHFTAAQQQHTQSTTVYLPMLGIYI